MKATAEMIGLMGGGGIDECEENARRAYDDRDQCEGGLRRQLLPFRRCRRVESLADGLLDGGDDRHPLAVSWGAAPDAVGWAAPAAPRGELEPAPEP